MRKTPVTAKAPAEQAVEHILRATPIRDHSGKRRQALEKALGAGVSACYEAGLAR